MRKTRTCAISRKRSSRAGFALVEALVIIAVLGVLLLLLIPALYNPTTKAARMKCASNLKQIALSMKMYEGDNDGFFPWQVQSAEGLPQAPDKHAEVWRYFLTLSNELGSTKILICPDDKQRVKNAATSFSGVTNSLLLREKRNRSISYFTGPYGGTNSPNAIMLGDRHISASDSADLYRSPANVPALVGNDTAGWAIPVDREYHELGGNLGRYDGGVDRVDTERLRVSLKGAQNLYGTNVNRFLFPQ